jgi:hypothetical protein
MTSAYIQASGILPGRISWPGKFWLFAGQLEFWLFLIC